MRQFRARSSWNPEEYPGFSRRKRTESTLPSTEQGSRLTGSTNAAALRADELAILLFERIKRLEMKYEPAPGFCEHGVRDGDWCEECNKAYKEARREEETQGL